MSRQNTPSSPLLASLLMLILLGSVSPLQAQETPIPQTPPATTVPEKYAPGIHPEALWDGRAMAPFRAMDLPRVVPASDASFLDDSEYILGITVRGESRAYPTRFVWWHHVVNDRLGKTEAGGLKDVAVTYCSVCNTGIRYDPVVNGKKISLDFYGLYNGVVALYDRESGTVFSQATGEAIKGPLVGEKLKMGSLLDTTWGQWKKLHPDTLVMSPEGPYTRYYRAKDKPEPRGYSRFPLPFFQKSLTYGDKRLPPFDKVLAVTLSDEKAESKPDLHRAYPIAALQNGVINDTLGDTPVAIFFDPDTVAAVAVSRVLDKKTLTFETRKSADGKSVIYDKETGTQWNIEGLGEEGPLAGKSLTRLQNHLSQWYGWVAYFPDTSIYGRTDPPQPYSPLDPPPTAEAKSDKL